MPFYSESISVPKRKTQMGALGFESYYRRGVALLDPLALALFRGPAAGPANALPPRCRMAILFAFQNRIHISFTWPVFGLGRKKSVSMKSVLKTEHRQVLW